MLKSIEKNDTINSIDTGYNLEGDLVSTGDVRVDGILKGSVKTAGKLVLGDAGIIEGKTQCKSAIRAGEIKGTVQTEELLTLKATAKLSGEIITSKLAIEPGAIFSGKCSMGPVIKKMNKNEEKTSSSRSEKTA